jgi:vitamin K-dependent gamma-carboxylase-like protein
LKGRLDRFLFAPVDARTAAAFRVMLAAILAWAFASRGLAAAPPLLHLLPVTDLFYDRVVLTPAYYAVVCVALALFATGWRSRAAGVALLILLVPLASLTRGQQSRQVLLFTLAAFTMLRSDARWSVSAWLARRRARSGGDAAPARPEPEAPPTAGPLWPIRLIQIQLSILYAVNAAAKATPSFLSGDELVAMARMKANFLVDISDGVVHLGSLQVPVALAAIGTVATESFLATGFWWPRSRWVAALVGVGFHLTLMAVVTIFMLDWVSMFLYLAFLLPWRARYRS